ncbi:small gtp binding protein rab8 [Anaeramoeba ignava]|uniref:Small gtp binding protein rab8 n=1 Tax=Anaeramoeba ignava TaxID=1746090 RepID=A0A9Q0L8I5_ANAIG|nr:small gtp binding protein rab8 [Anaeramoeba ignava]
MINSKNVGKKRKAHFKMAIIGEENVGRKTIILRVCETKEVDNRFEELGNQFQFKQMKGPIIDFTWEIWKGLPEHSNNFRGANGIMIVYDITNEKSLTRVNSLYHKLRDWENENAEFVLIGNKCDLQKKRKISSERGKALADELKIPFYETSAKKDINLKEAFDNLIMNCFERSLPDKFIKNFENFSLSDDLRHLLERKEFCDFEIECQDDRNPFKKITIPVHKLIIQTRLKINENQLKNQFYSILYQNPKKKVDVLLRWIYYGRVLNSNLLIFEEWKNRLSNISTANFKKGKKYLVEDLKNLMTQEENKDFQIISNDQIITVHKIILIARSELFRGMFMYVTEDESNQVHEYSHKQTETMKSLIHFFYTDELPQTNNQIIYQELKELLLFNFFLFIFKFIMIKENKLIVELFHLIFLNNHELDLMNH